MAWPASGCGVVCAHRMHPRPRTYVPQLTVCHRSSFVKVVEGVRRLVNVFVSKGYALQGRVDDVQASGSGNLGGKLRVRARFWKCVGLLHYALAAAMHEESSRSSEMPAPFFLACRSGWTGLPPSGGRRS